MARAFYPAFHGIVNTTTKRRQDSLRRAQSNATDSDQDFMAGKIFARHRTLHGGTGVGTPSHGRASIRNKGRHPPPSWTLGPIVAQVPDRIHHQLKVVIEVADAQVALDAQVATTQAGAMAVIPGQPTGALRCCADGTLRTRDFRPLHAAHVLVVLQFHQPFQSLRSDFRLQFNIMVIGYQGQLINDL
jgi:hypothetical protein